MKKTCLLLFLVSSLELSSMVEEVKLRALQDIPANRGSIEDVGSSGNKIDLSGLGLDTIVGISILSARYQNNATPILDIPNLHMSISSNFLVDLSEEIGLFPHAQSINCLQ